MRVRNLIFQSEVNGYLKKIENHNYYQTIIISIKNFSQQSSSFRLISQLKKLVEKVISLEKKKDEPNEEEVEMLYEEFQEIVIENFDEKKEITRQKKCRENYENLFIFLVFFFKKLHFV